MHGLPEDLIVKVTSDFVEERQAPELAIHNYADWLRLPATGLVASALNSREG